MACAWTIRIKRRGRCTARAPAAPLAVRCHCRRLPPFHMGSLAACFSLPMMQVRLFSVIKYESVIHEFVSGGCLRSCERVD